ncbi:MAG: LmbE-like protein [Chloroflexi bacterium]|nr:LmbE-like protein [Chloroflexota bacterium]
MSISFQPTIAAVIPAFNERGRLKNVLQAVSELPELTEIIVVDDGSTDGTELDALEVRSADPRIRTLRQEPNQGKARAMTIGAQAAQSELLLFLDADLYNMNPENVRALIEPVRSGKADMTIGVFRGGKWNTDLSQRVNPYLSGQRCIPRQLFFEVPLDKVVGYGIEAAFTIVSHQKHWRTRFVPLRGAYHDPSEVRRGSLWKGLRWKMGMFSQIYQTYDEGWSSYPSLFSPWSSLDSAWFITAAEQIRMSARNPYLPSTLARRSDYWSSRRTQMTRP